MRISLLGGSVFALALAACAGHQQRANDPNAGATSTTSTTGVSVYGGPISPGDQMGVAPANGAPGVQSGSPASPMEGACPQGDPSPAANDREECLKSCRGLDQMVPLGSSCMSEYGSCAAKCDAKF